MRWREVRGERWKKVRRRRRSSETPLRVREVRGGKEPCRIGDCVLMRWPK